jgi:purine-cytosine permease-like protein
MQGQPTRKRFSRERAAEFPSGVASVRGLFSEWGGLTPEYSRHVSLDLILTIVSLFIGAERSQ